jgi:hypothetical protein
MGRGCRIIHLKDEYRRALKDNEAVSAGYEKIIPNLKIGLAIDPSKAFKSGILHYDKLKRCGIFASFIIRLATNIPIDIPFWFDLDKKNDVLLYGRTLVKTYRTSRRYTYIIDKDEAANRLAALTKNFNELLQLYLDDPKSHHRLLRAIEFSGIGYQTFHLLTRLVNQITFMEILFSSQEQELSYQLASRISWYLRYSDDPTIRETLFGDIKKLYTARSKIVHGGETKKLLSKVGSHLESAEELNSEIFRTILQRNHIDVFNISGNNRNEEFKRLSLGIPCGFFPKS